MNTLFLCFVICVVSLFFGCSGDPNEKANELYGQASQLVESAKQAGSYSAALPLYEQARDTLERIVSQYTDSTIAVGLVSGQTKISNVTFSEFQELGGSLRRYAKAEQDPLSCALVVAGTVKIEYRRIDAVIDIARVFVKAGQAEPATLALSQALDLANATEAEFTKVRALVDIANEFVELGQPEKASPLLSRALDIANTYPQWEEAAWAAAGCNEEPGCGDFEPRSATVHLFVEIAGGLTKAGQTEQAESLLLQAFELSDGISWSFIKGIDLAEIVTGLVEAGQFTQAIVVAKTIRSEDGRGTALQAIERALVEAGQTEQADSLLAQTLDLINTYTFMEEEDKSRAMRNIAGSLARAGQFTRALTVANTLKAESDKASALVTIADGLTGIGQTERAAQVLFEALTVANTLKAKFAKTWTLIRIADGLTEIGQTEQATQALFEALTVANTLETESDKASALVTIADGLTEIGQTERATQTLSQVLDLANIITWDYRKALALRGIVSGLAKAGQVTQALDLANIITWEDGKTLALGIIVSELAKAGRTTQALSIANALKEGYQKASVLIAIARGLTKAGQSEQAVSIFTQALAVAETLKEGHRKASIPVDITRELTKAGQLTQALAVANTIKEADDKDSAVAAIARKLTEAGQFTQALAVTKTIKDEYRPGYEQKYRKAVALADIASEFVKAGHQPSENEVAILREIIQTAMPMEKVWKTLEEHSSAATNKE